MGIKQKMGIDYMCKKSKATLNKDSFDFIYEYTDGWMKAKILKTIS